MHGLMMNTPLLISSLIKYAAQYHRDTQVVTRTLEGPIRFTDFEKINERAKKLACGLLEFGIKSGDRIATLAWNTDRHLELYYGISGIGAICHTLNLRLSDEELIYIINHAEDKLLFYDHTLKIRVEKISPHLKSVQKFVSISKTDQLENKDSDFFNYENFLSEKITKFDWPIFNENQAASLCYTSGTTGSPKGVLYSHRTTVIHALASCLNNVLALRVDDVVLPVVPMFHVNAWGIPYSVPISGAKLVMPGDKLDGENLFELMDIEGVTIALGVPTVWLSLLDYMDKKGRKPKALERVIIGGAAVSESMIDRFEIEYGVNVHHAWGMTEMSPIGVLNSLKPKFSKLSRANKMPTKLKQGRGIYGVELLVVDDDGKELPRDGVSSGHLLVRGPWIIDKYYKEKKSALTKDGWFDTGDIATIDHDGYMNITDRSKDIIKSGGEWISSVGLENVVVGHDAVLQAAVIGVSHPKWQERPLLICVPKGSFRPSLEEMNNYLSDKVPKMWLPDAIEWVEKLPIGATGKIVKAELRKIYKNYKL